MATPHDIAGTDPRSGTTLVPSAVETGPEDVNEASQRLRALRLWGFSTRSGVLTCWFARGPVVIDRLP